MEGRSLVDWRFIVPKHSMSIHTKRLRNSGGRLFNLHFRSKNARWLVTCALLILGFPIALWLIGYLGDCVVSSMDSYCNNLPDFVAHFLFAFYIFLVVGGITISAILAIVAILMLVLGIALEMGARKRAK